MLQPIATNCRIETFAEVLWYEMYVDCLRSSSLLQEGLSSYKQTEILYKNNFFR